VREYFLRAVELGDPVAVQSRRDLSEGLGTEKDPAER
jgi:hypothetical protein